MVDAGYAFGLALIGIVVSLVVGWFSAKSLYNWGYMGHHHEYWRGWDDRYDVMTGNLRHRYDEAPKAQVGGPTP